MSIEINKGQLLAIAFRQFKKKNQDLFIASTLGKNDPDRYLENRLWTAFMSGAEKQDKIHSTKAEQ